MYRLDFILREIRNNWRVLSKRLIGSDLRFHLLWELRYAPVEGDKIRTSETNREAIGIGLVRDDDR